MFWFFFVVAAGLPYEVWGTHRVVSMGPQVTEIVFQLKKQEALVAVSQGSDYPEVARKIPRIGSVFLPGVEAIIRLRPDWVVTDAQTANAAAKRALLALRIPHFHFDVTSVEGLVLESKRFLREVFRQPTYPELASYEECIKRIPRASKPFTFLLFAWGEPAILFGHRTFLSDLLTKVGGKNLLPDEWPQPFPQVAAEWLVKRRPEVVFYLEDESSAARSRMEVVKRLWGLRPVKMVALPSRFFGRASFTPLYYLQHLGLEGLSGEICHES